MVDFDDHLARADLCVGEHLRVVVDRTARDVVGLEQVEPVLARLPDRDGFDLCRERRAVAHAARVVGKLRQRRPVVAFEDVTELAEQPLVGGAEGDVSVGAPDGLIRRVHAVRRSQRRGYDAARKVFGRFPHRQRDAGVQQRCVDVLADPRTVSGLDGRQNAHRREEPGAEIGQRHARLHRRTAGLARHRHDPGRALRDQIETAFRSGGSCLTVARNRRVDEPRVDRGQRAVAQPEPVHHPRTIVLD
jgi:hypothetical protein